jgi:putative chitinase
LIEITAERLHAFAPNAPAEAAQALDAAACRFKINSPARIAHWLGQAFHESGGFTRLSENLNYSAQRLCEVWPSRFPNIEAASHFAFNPQALADKVYGGRMGNTQPGDGWRFRGGGYFQLTGRETYTAAAAGTGLDINHNPDLIRSPYGAAISAGWFWSSKGLNVLADVDDIVGITKRINGGLIGLAERKAAVARAKVIWSHA